MVPSGLPVVLLGRLFQGLEAPPQWSCRGSWERRTGEPERWAAFAMGPDTLKE